MYSRYYQAYVTRSQAWFFVATLRSIENAAFDRTLDTSQSLFEIFVPEGYVPIFTAFMQEQVRLGVVQSYTQEPNRLQYEAL